MFSEMSETNHAFGMEAQLGEMESTPAIRQRPDFVAMAAGSTKSGSGGGSIVASIVASPPGGQASSRSVSRRRTASETATAAPRDAPRIQNLRVAVGVSTDTFPGNFGNIDFPLHKYQTIKIVVLCFNF